MINADLSGVLNCSQTAIAILRGREGAMIGAVSSVGGRYGVENWSIYSATKFAVGGFRDALTSENVGIPHGPPSTYSRVGRGSSCRRECTCNGWT